MEANMAKRKDANTLSFENHDAIPDTVTPDIAAPGIAMSLVGGEDDIPAAEIQADVETAEALSPMPVAMPVQNEKPEISTFNLITRARVEELIKNRSLLAAGMGIVPLPLFNLVSTTAIQVSMVQSITRLYNIEVKKSWIKNIIASVLGGLGATALSGVAAKNLGAAPLLGISLAALSAPAMNGFATYAIGYMFVCYFEAPEGFLKANAGALKEWFADGFKDGREKLGGLVAGKARRCIAYDRFIV
jgi:uncharacterized protein (DUF697 family)